MSKEIELKFAIKPADAAAFRRLELLSPPGAASAKPRKVFNAYFDTPDLALLHGGMALRLRKAGGKWQQTLKTAGTSIGGMHQRGEWEHALPAPQLDLALFRDTPLAALAQHKRLHLRLKPVFTTDFTRTTWQIGRPPDQRVEVALDQGLVQCGDQTAPISEVEIELLAGDPATALNVAAALASLIDLRPEAISKAERGYRLLHPASLAPRHHAAGSIELKREWPPLQALQIILRACLAQFDANVEGALGDEPAEYIHQLRVALRRLRSALRLLKPVQGDHIKQELKWLTAVLGAAREWDVLMAETLPALLDAYGDGKLAAVLMAAGGKEQTRAHAAARAALTSSRHALLMLALGRWLHVPGAMVLQTGQAQTASHMSDKSRDAKPSPHSLQKIASHEIQHCHRQLVHVGARLADLSASKRHRVRIDAKRLRYAADFFTSLFPRRRTTRYLKILGDIQELLGIGNDDAVAMRLIVSLAPPAPFSKFARRWLEARTQTMLADIDRPMNALKKLRRFW